MSLVHRVAGCAGVVASAIAAVPVAGQQVDTLARRAARDSALVLPALEVRVSILPAITTAVGSGIPASLSNLDGTELRAWRPQTLRDAVMLQPGVSLYDDLGSQQKASLQLRGFSVGPTVGLPSGVAVFLDGVRQNEPDAQEVNFDLLPMAFVKRVEVLRGTGALLGPNAIGGAINLVTDRGDGTTEGNAEISAGSFGAATLAGSYGNGIGAGWWMRAAATGEHARGWREATGSDGASMLASVSRVRGKRGITIQGHGSRSRAGTAGSLPESIFSASPATNFTPGDADDLAAGQLSATAFAPAARGDVSVTAHVRDSYADRFHANQPPDDDVRDRTTNLTGGVRVDYRASWNAPIGRVGAHTGIDVTADRVSVRLFAIDRKTRDAQLTTDVLSPRIAAAAYAIFDVAVRRLTVSAGARYDHLSSPFQNRLDPADRSGNRFRNLSPRAGATLDLGGDVSVYASAGASFRAPALLELGCADPSAACPLPFALGADPPLAPVRARTYETGIQWLLGRILVHAAAYRTDVDDEIFFIASNASLASGYFTNLSRTRRAGVELSAQGTAAGERVSWNASWARSSSTFQSDADIFSVRSDSTFAASPLAGDNTVRSGAALPMVPASMAKVGGTIQLTGALSVFGNVDRTGTQWLRGDEANETRPLNAYSVASLGAMATWRSWTVRTNVRNVLDSRAAIFGTFNENRRTASLERFLTPLQPRAHVLVLSRRLR